jgi:hypothetical protein
MCVDKTIRLSTILSYLIVLTTIHVYCAAE